MIEQLKPAELLRRCRSGEFWQLLDVREPWETDLARVAPEPHMPLTTIPMAEIPSRHGELDPARPVAVMCHSGGRSARVAAWLAGNGYERVANVEGGIDAWAVESDASIPRY